MAEKIHHAGRAHALLSASGAELWLNCSASAIACTQYPDETSEYAQEGTIAHEVAQVYAEAVLGQCGHSELDAELNALADRYGAEVITAEMKECAEGYAAYIQERVTGDADVVLLEQRLDFSEYVPDGFGTGDCVIISDGVLTVIDYKYGQGIAVVSENNPQMMLYALGAIHDYGILYDFDRVNMSIYQPRINNISEATLTVDELLVWAETVVQPRAAEAFSGKAAFHAGAHCRKFCKHAGRCPTLTAYCCDFAETHGLRMAVPHLTDDQYVEVVKMESVLKMWLDRVTRQAIDRIMAGDKLPGLKVVEGASRRKWSNEGAVEETLSGTYKAEEILEPPTLKSVAAMEKAIGKKKVSELVGNLIEKAPGKPTLTLASDKRPDYNLGADFAALD